MKIPASLSKLTQTISHIIERYFMFGTPTKASWAMVMAKLPAGMPAQAEKLNVFHDYPALFPRELPPYQNYQSVINSTWATIAIQNGVQPKARAKVIDMRDYMDMDSVRRKATQPSGPFSAREERPMPAYRIAQEPEIGNSIFPITPLPRR